MLIVMFSQIHRVTKGKHRMIQYCRLQEIGSFDRIHNFRWFAVELQIIARLATPRLLHAHSDLTIGGKYGGGKMSHVYISAKAVSDKRELKNLDTASVSSMLISAHVLENLPSFFFLGLGCRQH